MAGDSSGGGANVFLSFVMGAVLVAVSIVGFFMWDNYKAHTGGGAAPTNVTLNVKHQ